MKKTLAIVLVTILSMMVMASAAITSPTLDITFETSAEGFIFEIDDSESAVEAAAEELAKAAEDADAYFGEAADEAKAITGNDELEIVEFAPVTVGGYTDDMGDISITITAPTAAEEGQAVAVMLCVNGEWTAFEGVGNADGSIDFTLSAEVAKAASEAGSAMLAIAF